MGLQRRPARSIAVLAVVAAVLAGCTAGTVTGEAVAVGDRSAQGALVDQTRSPGVSSAAGSSTAPSSTAPSSTAPSSTAPSSDSPSSGDPTRTSTTASRPQASTDPDDLLTVGITSVPEVLDPAAGWWSWGESVLWRQVFQTLTARVGDDPTPVASLASSWAGSDDGTEWTFQLPNGGRFHDGEVVTGAAVCANFDHWFTATGAEQDRYGAWAYYFGGFAGDDDASYTGCTAIGYTVDLSFDTPSYDLPDVLVDPAFSIHSPDSFDSDVPVGSGRYRWVDGDDDGVELAAVAPEGGTGPEVIRFVPTDRATAAVRLADGSIDLYYGASNNEEVPRGVRTDAAPTGELISMTLLGGRGQLTDPALRAIVHSVLERSDLAASIGMRPAVGLIPRIADPAPVRLPAALPAARRTLPAGTGPIRVVTAGGGSDTATMATIARRAGQLLTAAGIRNTVTGVSDLDSLTREIDAGRVDVTVGSAWSFRQELWEYVSGFHSEDVRGDAVPRTIADRVDGLVEDSYYDERKQDRRRVAVAALDALVAERVLVPVADLGAVWWLGPRVRSIVTAPFDLIRMDQVVLR